MNVARTPAFVALALSTLLALSACDTGAGIEGGGALAGTVVAEGSGQPGPSPHLNLYASPTDFDLRRNGARIDLTGQGFPFDFRIQNLIPGTYYLEACFDFGCVAYQNGGDAGIPVNEGETTTITLTVTP